MKTQKQIDLYTKVKNYATQVFGLESDSLTIKSDIEVTLGNKTYVITFEDLELSIEEAKEKYQNKLEEERKKEELRIINFQRLWMLHVLSFIHLKQEKSIKKKRKKNTDED